MSIISYLGIGSNSYDQFGIATKEHTLQAEKNQTLFAENVRIIHFFKRF